MTLEEQAKMEEAMKSNQEALYKAINKKYENDSASKKREYTAIKDAIKTMLDERNEINKNQIDIDVTISASRSPYPPYKSQLTHGEQKLIAEIRKNSMERTQKITDNMIIVDDMARKYDTQPVFGAAIRNKKDALNASVVFQNVISKEANKDLQPEIEKEAKSKRPLPSNSYEGIDAAMKQMGAELD